jgi:sulfur carrier protein ThiS
MRMHRGSSKGPQASPAAPGSLPLSAPVSVEFEIVRAGGSETTALEIASGTLLRDALHLLDLAPEGCAVLQQGHSVPLDSPVSSGARFTVIRTFSGG